MKKLLFSALLLTSIANANTLDMNMSVTDLDTFGNRTYSTLVSRVTFNSEIQHDLSIDDDIYFQNGKQVLEAEIDKTEAFCKIDTDVDEGTLFSNERINIEGNNLTIKYGMKRAISDVDVRVSIKNNEIEYRIDFLQSGVMKPTDVIDELECVTPILAGKDITIQDIVDIMGNRISIDLVDVEQ